MADQRPDRRRRRPSPGGDPPKKRPNRRPPRRDADEEAAELLGLDDDAGDGEGTTPAARAPSAKPDADAKRQPPGFRAVATKNRPEPSRRDEAAPPAPADARDASEDVDAETESLRPKHVPEKRPEREPSSFADAIAAAEAEFAESQKAPKPKSGRPPRKSADAAAATPAGNRPAATKAKRAAASSGDPPARPASATKQAAAKPGPVAVPVEKPKRSVVDRGRRVPIAGLVTVLVVAGAALFEYWNHERRASPVALVAVRSDLAAIRGRVASLEATVGNNVNPDSRARKLGALNKAVAERDRIESAEREARHDFEMGLERLAERWRTGTPLHFVETYMVIVGAALIPGDDVQELTSTFGYFAAETGRETVAGVVLVGVVSSLGWATAGLMLALLARWLVRAPLWKAVGRPPFGLWDRPLGLEAPWFACGLRMIPFLPSWPLDLVAGVMPVSKLALFVALFFGSLIPAMLAAFVGVDAPSLLAVRIGDATPSMNAWLYASVGGLGLIALRVAVSPSVRGGVTKLNEMADDAEAPTLEDAARDISELDDEGPRFGGDRRRGR